MSGNLLDATLQSFTQTTADFVQPAVNSSVLVRVVSSSWIPVGIGLYVATGGNYAAAATPNGSTVMLTNLGGSGATTPGVTVPAGARIATGAVPGAAGAPTFGKFGVEADTVALWNFNGDLTDSAHGHTLVRTASTTERFTDFWPTGVQCYQQAGAQPRSLSTALQLFGDMTIDLLGNFWGVGITDDLIVGFGTGVSSSSSADNSAYEIYLNAKGPGWRQHHGSHVAEHWEPDAVTLPTGPFVLTATRTANVIQFYLNGRPLGGASSTLTTPDGGSSGYFGLPFVGLGDIALQFASLRLSNTAHSAAQVKIDRNAALGAIFGVIP